MLHLLVALFMFNGMFCSNEQNNNNQKTPIDGLISSANRGKKNKKNNNQSIVNITINNEIPKTYDFLNLAGDALMPINNNSNYIDVDDNSNNKKADNKKPDNVNSNLNLTNRGYIIDRGYVIEPSYMSLIPITRQNQINNVPSARNEQQQRSLEQYNNLTQSVRQNHTAIELLHKENQKIKEKNNNLNNTVNKITNNLNKLIYDKQQEDNLKKSEEDIETKFNKFVDIMLNQEQKYLTQSEIVSNIQEENDQLKNEVTGLKKTIQEQNNTINNLMKSFMERVTKIENKNKNEEGQNRFLDFVVENTNKRLDALEEKNNDDKITGKKRKNDDNNKKEKKRKMKRYV